MSSLYQRCPRRPLQTGGNASTVRATSVTRTAYGGCWKRSSEPVCLGGHWERSENTPPSGCSTKQSCTTGRQVKLQCNTHQYRIHQVIKQLLNHSLPRCSTGHTRLSRAVGITHTTRCASRLRRRWIASWLSTSSTVRRSGTWEVRTPLGPAQSTTWEGLCPVLF